MSVSDILAKVDKRQRLSLADGQELFANDDLSALSLLADKRRRQMKDDNIVSYILDRNINYTNVCVANCSFCAFYRKPRAVDAYVLSYAEIDQKIEETIALGGIQILLQGGLNPALKLDYYVDLFQHIKGKYPEIHLHALSPPEILYIAKLMNMSVADVLEALIAAGLDSIPGGGAEILVEDVRDIIASHKWKPDAWLGVMREAHKQGLLTTATMMFGSIESTDDRLRHMLAVRELQDETGGFTAFIPWTFQPENNSLGARLNYRKASAHDYLQTVAIVRLMLDNVPNIQASWVTMGAEIAQLSLAYGVNDFGSLMIEENVVRQAGAAFRMSEDKMQHLIAAMGYTPRRRNQHYELLAQQVAL
jgi:cyclic dehypoxanthinyl futalosine synthase